jgi:hypothetical protein
MLAPIIYFVLFEVRSAEVVQIQGRAVVDQNRHQQFALSKFLVAIAPEERLASDVCKRSTPNSSQSEAFFEDSLESIYV